MITTVIAILMSLCVQAGTYIRNHEDFVHLSEHEKNELIIKTMELVVALESQYNYEVRTSGYDSTRFKKFIEAVSKVKSILFIDSAYAANNPGKRKFDDWNSYGNAFKDIMTKNGSSNCLFAGWPSKAYVNKNGKTYCAHPDFINGTGPNRHTEKKMTLWTTGYPNPDSKSGCGVNDQRKILCNPAIFGFKKASDKSLFCVDTLLGAENSAFNCMKEALKDRPSDGDTDSKDLRLTALKASLGANKEALKAIQEFAYKSCVCDSTPANLNRDYQTYMRKHRTCFGLMEMMSAATCGTNPLLDTAIFDNFKKYTNGKIFYNQSSTDTEKDTIGSVVDDHYEKFIKTVKESAKDDYLRLCNPEKAPPKKEYVCTEATCQTTVADGKTSFACSTFAIKVKNSNETASFDKSPTEVPTSDNQKSMDFSGTIGDAPVKLTCKLDIKPPESKPVEYVCKASCQTIAAVAPSKEATFDCKFEAHKENKRTHLASFSILPTEKPAAGAVPKEGLKLDIKNKIGTQEVNLSCSLTIIPAKPVDTPPITENKIEYACDKATCSAGAAQAEKVMTGIAVQDPPPPAAAFNCDIEAHDKAKTADKIALKGSPSGTPTNGGNSTFVVKIADKDVSLSCKVSMTTAPITPTEEVKPPERRLSGPAPQGPRPPQMMIRQSSDTSAVGIK